MAAQRSTEALHEKPPTASGSYLHRMVIAGNHYTNAEVENCDRKNDADINADVRTFAGYFDKTISEMKEVARRKNIAVNFSMFRPLQRRWFAVAMRTVSYLRRRSTACGSSSKATTDADLRMITLAMARLMRAVNRQYVEWYLEDAAMYARMWSELIPKEGDELLRAPRSSDDGADLVEVSAAVAVDLDVHLQRIKCHRMSGEQRFVAAHLAMQRDSQQAPVLAELAEKLSQRLYGDASSSAVDSRAPSLGEDAYMTLYESLAALRHLHRTGEHSDVQQVARVRLIVDRILAPEPPEETEDDHRPQRNRLIQAGSALSGPVREGEANFIVYDARGNTDKDTKQLPQDRHIEDETVRSLIDFAGYFDETISLMTSTRRSPGFRHHDIDFGLFVPLQRRWRWAAREALAVFRNQEKVAVTDADRKACAAAMSRLTGAVDHRFVGTFVHGWRLFLSSWDAALPPLGRSILLSSREACRRIASRLELVTVRKLDEFERVSRFRRLIEPLLSKSAALRRLENNIAGGYREDTRRYGIGLTAEDYMSLYESATRVKGDIDGPDVENEVYYMKNVIRRIMPSVDPRLRKKASLLAHNLGQRGGRRNYLEVD